MAGGIALCAGDADMADAAEKTREAHLKKESHRAPNAFWAPGEA